MKKIVLVILIVSNFAFSDSIEDYKKYNSTAEAYKTSHSNQEVKEFYEFSEQISKLINEKNLFPSKELLSNYLKEMRKNGQTKDSFNYIRNIIKNGSNTNEKEFPAGMPDNMLTKNEDIENLIKWLTTGRKGKAPLSNAICEICHGIDGEGIEAVGPKINTLEKHSISPNYNLENIQENKIYKVDEENKEIEYVLKIVNIKDSSDINLLRAAFRKKYGTPYIEKFYKWLKYRDNDYSPISYYVEEDNKYYVVEVIFFERKIKSDVVIILKIINTTEKVNKFVNIF